ncbi:14389_t:CDS:2, partial [Cetraspora pellucida]
EINKLQGKLEVREEEIDNLVNQLKKEPIQVKENQKIFEKTKDLLVVKEIFLNMRQTTIKGLQNCYNKKCMEIDTANKATKIIEELASFVNFLVPEFLKKTVETIKNSFQKKFSDKQVDEFKELLINDKENLFLLNKDIIDKIYRPLSKSGLKVRLENGEPLLFNGRYKIFEIENDI